MKILFKIGKKIHMEILHLGINHLLLKQYILTVTNFVLVYLNLRFCLPLILKRRTILLKLNMIYMKMNLIHMKMNLIHMKLSLMILILRTLKRV